MNALSEKKCVPCQGGTQPLEKKEAEHYLQEVLSWELIDNGKKIQKMFEFKDFGQAMRFVNSVAEIAKSEDHHPDIFISYNKVKLTLFTHKIEGLHKNDFILASKIDKIGA